jgi:2-dehydro-3-deoxyphosphooctonate aldolase (KDO 8-P synthase)
MLDDPPSAGPLPVAIGALVLGNDRPFALIAGPCAIESLDHALETAHALVELCPQA